MSDLQILRAGMNAELDAINTYEQMKGDATNPDVKKILSHISKEEKTHFSEFQNELLKLDAEQARELSIVIPTPKREEFEKECRRVMKEIETVKIIPTQALTTTSRRMNSWICYLKACVKETNLTYLECVQYKDRSEREYYPKKEYWNQEALKGCPRGKV